VTEGQWEGEVEGLPYTISAEENGWVVIVASTTIARGENLTTLIVQASGGLVSASEADALATSVTGQ
jgi:hypothetical protein